MDATSIITSLISLLFGGGIATLVTIKSIKGKAAAEVKTVELDNVQEAVKIWREMAESLNGELKKANDDREALKDEIKESQKERAEILEEVGKLQKEITKLTKINEKIYKSLEKINGDNYSKIVEEIKNEIGKI